MKQFKYAQIYKGAPKTSKPSLEEDWYVFYSFLIPGSSPPKWKQFREKQGINRYKTIQERMDFGEHLARMIDRQLDSGFNPFGETDYLTIRDAIDWAVKKKQWAKSSRMVNNGIVEIFKKALNKNLNKSVLDFKRTDARETLDAMVGDRNVGNHSYNRYKICLHGIFQELVDWEKLDTNPFSFKGKKNPPKKLPPLLTDADAIRIREYLQPKDPDYLTYLMVINMTTIRMRETLNLKGEDIVITPWIDKEGKYRENWDIIVRAEIAKDNETRVVVVPEALRERLKPHIIEGHFLFGKKFRPQVRQKALPYSAVWHKWHKYVQTELEINSTPYLLKHLGIKTMLQTGVSPKGVQYQAGHSATTMTDIYSGKDATIYREQLEKFKGNL